MTVSSAVTDFSQFTRMRQQADANDPEVLRQVAGQFEALFVESLLKNMRSTSLGDPVFGKSDQHEMYLGMLDKQLSVEMSKGRGIGIADILVRQFGGDGADLRQPATVDRGDTSVPAYTGTAHRARAAVSPPDAADTWDSPADFVRDLWPHAERVARKLDVAPEALLAQAALETGWGEHVIRGPDGRNSFNLFGIKAGNEWQGASVTRQTLEYKDGVAYRERAKFRAYPDVGASFEDYAAFVGERPRYASVPGSGRDGRQFADALQAAGYATDPHYADKIDRVMNSNTLRDALRVLKYDVQPPINFGSSPVSAR